MSTTATGDPPPTNSIAWHLWVGCTATAVPALVAVILRFYARIKGRIPLRADDWLIVCALITVWVMLGLRFSQVIYYDLGRHTYYVPDWQVRDFKRSFLPTQVMYFLTATFTRCSILFFYRRIFVNKIFNILVWIVMSMVVCYFISCSVAAVWGCQPVSYFWNDDQPGSCMNEVLFFRVNGILNLVLDLVVLVMPLPMLWRLQMYWKKKIALTAIFSLGLFACLCSSFRLVQFQDPAWKNGTDPMWAFVHAGVWSSIEQSVGVICACLPCLRLLFHPRGWDEETDRRTTTGVSQVETTQRTNYDGSEKEYGIRDASSELELTTTLSMADSGAISASHTADSSAVGKGGALGDEQTGHWRTQEVYQNTTARGERNG